MDNQYLTDEELMALINQNASQMPSSNMDRSPATTIDQLGPSNYHNQVVNHDRYYGTNSPTWIPSPTPTPTPMPTPKYPQDLGPSTFHNQMLSWQRGHGIGPKRLGFDPSRNPGSEINIDQDINRFPDSMRESSYLQNVIGIMPQRSDEEIRKSIEQIKNIPTEDYPLPSETPSPTPRFNRLRERLNRGGV
jgi:hypothetical protein